jgi:hypothetical protein
MSSRARRVGVYLAGVGLLAGALYAAGAKAGLLYLVPVAVLTLLLLNDCFPGEKLIVRAVNRRSGGRRPGRPSRSAGGVRAPLRLAPRGSLLLARALAGRGPLGPHPVAPAPPAG